MEAVAGTRYGNLCSTDMLRIAGLLTLAGIFGKVLALRLPIPNSAACHCFQSEFIMLSKQITRFRLWCRLIYAACTSRSTLIFYDRISSFYDEFFVSHAVHADTMCDIIKSVFVHRTDTVTVLDLGCGTGLVSRKLAANRYDVVGVDISCQSLQMLPRDNPHMTGIQSEASVLPFKNARLDAVVCLGAWRHFGDPHKVVDEISTILKKNGICIIGYFPPAAAGLVSVNRPWLRHILCRIYGGMIKMLGYTDRTDDSLLRDTEDSFRRHFRDVRRITSGQNQFMVIAQHNPPLSRISNVCSTAP